MELSAREILSKLSRQKFWKYLEIKACLFKEPKAKIWKVGFIEVRLLGEPYEVVKEILPRNDSFMLIQKILPISVLDRIVDQIAAGQKITIGKTNASLEWIDDKLNYDLKTRASAKEEYQIDAACHVFFKTGRYNENLDRIIRRLHPLNLDGEEAYRDLKDVLSTLLGIEFGTPAFSPFISILAPIYVRIEESKAEIRKIEVLVSAAFEAELSKIGLIMFGEQENAEPSGLRESFRNFTRENDSEILNRIIVDLDDKTRYVKLNLYYNEDLLEDYYIRIPKLVVRHITESVGVTKIPAEEDIRRRKQEIENCYKRAKDENNSPEVKGKLLEDVIKEIIELVPGLRVVGSRVTNEIQEIDIVVRNFNKTNVWADFESVFFVECKNWFKKKKPGADKIRDFKGKLENKNIKTGIFVAPNGISEGKGDSKIRGTNGQIDKYFHNGTKIVLLEDEDIYEILNCEEVTDKINEKFIELYSE